MLVFLDYEVVMQSHFRTPRESAKALDEALKPFGDRIDIVPLSDKPRWASTNTLTIGLPGYLASRIRSVLASSEQRKYELVQHALVDIGLSDVYWLVITVDTAGFIPGDSVIAVEPAEGLGAEKIGEIVRSVALSVTLESSPTHRLTPQLPREVDFKLSADGDWNAWFDLSLSYSSLLGAGVDLANAGLSIAMANAADPYLKQLHIHVENTGVEFKLRKLGWRSGRAWATYETTDSEATSIMRCVLDAITTAGNERNDHQRL